MRIVLHSQRIPMLLPDDTTIKHILQYESISDQRVSSCLRVWEFQRKPFGLTRACPVGIELSRAETNISITYDRVNNADAFTTRVPRRERYKSSHGDLCDDENEKKAL